MERVFGLLLAMSLAGSASCSRPWPTDGWASTPDPDADERPFDRGPPPDDWDLAALVRWVAVNPDLARGGMGYEGRPSEGSVTAPKIARIASPATLVFLLSHDSYGVRAWIADEMVKRYPESRRPPTRCLRIASSTSRWKAARAT